MCSWAARMLVTHTIASLDGYLYITHTRNVNNQIKKLLLELSTVSALNFMCQKGAGLVAQKNPLTHCCLQSSSGKNYWPKCLVPMLAFFFQSVSALWEIISLSYNSLKPEGQTIMVWLDWKHPPNKDDYFSQRVSGTESIFYTHGSTNFCSKNHKIFISL